MRPRFTRDHAGLPFTVTERDVAILRFVHDARLVTSAELAVALAHLFPGRVDSLTRRLQKLYHHNLLHRPAARQLPRTGTGPQPITYSLAPFGKRTLFGDHYMERKNAVRAGEQLHVAHELLISAVHAAAAAACRSTDNLELPAAAWQQGDAAIAKDAKTGEVFARPDARFVIIERHADGTDDLFFHLEADRGTEPHSRLREKFEKYLAWNARRLWEQFTTAGVRTLIVTTTPGRAANLRTLGAEVCNGHAGALFWFTHAETFRDPAAFVRGPIWTTAESDTPRTLLEVD